MKRNSKEITEIIERVRQNYERQFDDPFPYEKVAEWVLEHYNKLQAHFFDISLSHLLGEDTLLLYTLLKAKCNEKSKTKGIAEREK